VQKGISKKEWNDLKAHKPNVFHSRTIKKTNQMLKVPLDIMFHVSQNLLQLHSFEQLEKHVATN